MLFIGIAICCAYAARGRKFDWKSILALIFGCVFFYAIVLVGRRGELLGAAICLGLLAVALCSKKQRRYLIIGGIIAAVVGFVAVVALLPWLKQFPALSRYVMTIEKLLKGQDITSGRLELYALAFDAFLDRPLFGIGWDQFHTLIPQSFLDAHGQDVEDVHCIYLQFLTEAGALGAPLLIAPLVYCYYLVCRQLSRLKERPDLSTARMLCICSFMVQSFLLVLGIYDPNFQRVIFWCFYALAIMMMLGALEMEGYTPDDRLSRLLGKFIHFCAPPFALVWGWVAGLFSRLRRNSPEKK
jgi:O-antigen ligase